MRRLSLVMVSLIILLTSACSNEAKRLNAEGEQYASFLPPETAKFGETFEVDPTNSITLTDAEIIEYDDIRYLLITYDWANGSNSPQTIDQNIRLSIMQGGAMLTPDLSPVSNTKRLVTQVPAMMTYNDIQQGFILENNEPIVLNFKGSQTYIFIDGRPESSYPVKVTLDPLTIEGHTGDES